MSRFTVFLRSGKVRKALVLLIFLVLPTSVIFTAWFTELWYFEESYDKKPLTSNEQEKLEHLEYNLENIQCPAQEGRHLSDYWACLWRTSITTEGMEQHRRILAENLVSDTRHNISAGNWKPKRKKRGATKRAVDNRPWGAKKMDALVKDTATVIYDEEIKRECQQKILPGFSIFWFWECIRGESEFKYSTDPTYGTTAYPQFKSEYHPNELKMLDLKETMPMNGNGSYKLKIEFKHLTDEEKLTTGDKEVQQYFEGADPYIDDDISPFRYRYNNLNPHQRQPAWSYRGLIPSSKWHELDGRKFLLPLKKSANLDGIELLSDLAQAYPGIGEVAAGLNTKLNTPMDYRWTKDSGYTAYTRFLLPIYSHNDVSYYKSKKLMDSSLKIRPYAEDIQDIINGLEEFQDKAKIPIATHVILPIPPFDDLVPNAQFQKEEDIPFVNEYNEFIHRFFGIDMLKYKAWIASNGGNVLYKEYEVVRSLLQAYVEVVRVQEFCIMGILKKFDDRQDILSYDHNFPEKIPRQLREALDAALSEKQCKFVKKLSEIRTANQYKMTLDNFKKIYTNYFDRRNVRKSYSLPRFPVEYKVCRQTDQSPLNILTKHGRKSSIKDYVFGDAAYRLNRFFMFFPIDSSTLLTVGIVDGERYDESSPQMSGGAIKGENLTFQYMHIRFGNKWDGIGSEHWIDGKGAAMELQMVFTIAGTADPIKYWHVLARVQNELFQFRGKLVIIISVLVDVLETDEAVMKKIEEEKLKQDPYLFEPLAQAAYHFRRIPEKNHTYQQPRGYVSKDPVFRLIDFIPRKSSKFYTYRGSLSWPPCFGYVIWSVYEQRLYMSRRQFLQFVKIPAYGMNTNNFAHNNFRKFDDIYVEDENNALLDYATIQEMKKRRTKDRHVLVGYHEVNEDGTEQNAHGLVGEEFYYEDSGDGNSGVTFRKTTFPQFSNCTPYILGMYLWGKIWQALIT